MSEKQVPIGEMSYYHPVNKARIISCANGQGTLSKSCDMRISLYSVAVVDQQKTQVEVLLPQPEGNLQSLVVLVLKKFLTFQKYSLLTLSHFFKLKNNGS